MRPKYCGFTLVEVLVALVIMAVAMTSLMIALTELTEHQTYLKRKPLALWVAKNVIVKSQLGVIPPALKEGDETQLDHHYHWKLTHFDTPYSDIQRITVKVSENGREIQSLEGFKKVKRQ